ncbi:MAG TPA: MarR family transcriptional regulator, partial [Anaerolineales bacterium]
FVERSMRSWKRFARDAGLSMPQFSIIMQLHFHGSCSVSDISERFETTSAAASQSIERLVQSGYLERAEDPNDRRSRLLTLSPKGQELVGESIRERYRWVDDLESHLNPDEKQKITDGLAIMVQAAQHLEPAVS